MLSCTLCSIPCTVQFLSQLSGTSYSLSFHISFPPMGLICKACVSTSCHFILLFLLYIWKTCSICVLSFFVCYLFCIFLFCTSFFHLRVFSSLFHILCPLAFISSFVSYYTILYNLMCLFVGISRLLQFNFQFIDDHILLYLIKRF